MPMPMLPNVTGPQDEDMGFDRARRLMGIGPQQKPLNPDNPYYADALTRDIFNLMSGHRAQVPDRVRPEPPALEEEAGPTPGAPRPLGKGTSPYYADPLTRDILNYFDGHTEVSPSALKNASFGDWNSPRAVRERQQIETERAMRTGDDPMNGPLAPEPSPGLPQAPGVDQAARGGLSGPPVMAPPGPPLSPRQGLMPNAIGGMLSGETSRAEAAAARLKAFEDETSDLEQRDDPRYARQDSFDQNPAMGMWQSGGRSVVSPYRYDQVKLSEPDVRSLGPTPEEAAKEAAYQQSFDQRNTIDRSTMDARIAAQSQAGRGYGNPGIAEGQGDRFAGAPMPTRGQKSADALMASLAGYNPAISPRGNVGSRKVSEGGQGYLTDSRGSLRIPTAPQQDVAGQKWQRAVDQFHAQNPDAYDLKNPNKPSTVMIGKTKWTPEMQAADPKGFQESKAALEKYRDSPLAAATRARQQEMSDKIAAGAKAKRNAADAEDRATRLARIQFQQEKTAGRNRAAMAGPIAIAQAQAQGEANKHPRRETMVEKLDYIRQNFGDAAVLGAVMGPEGAPGISGMLEWRDQHKEKSKTGSGYGPPQPGKQDKPLPNPIQKLSLLRKMAEMGVGFASNPVATLYKMFAGQ